MGTEGTKELLPFLAGTQIYIAEALSVTYGLMGCVDYGRKSRHCPSEMIICEKKQ